MRDLLLILLILTLSQCTNVERSEIERVTIDPELIKSIKSDYDTFYVDMPKKFDFYKVEIYSKDSTIDNFIFKDSIDNILAIRLTKDNVDVYVQEFYPNGQAKGKTDFGSHVRDKMSGAGTYYYKDGRVKARGRWTNGKRTGEWKWYKEDGYLTSIESLDDNGETIKKVEIE